MNGNGYQNSAKLFLKSAFTIEGGFIKTNELIDWVDLQAKRANVKLRKVGFGELTDWVLTDDGIAHKTGRFFSIGGIRVRTNWGAVEHWDQPIIIQPEVGYLGFITKEITGVLHFLVQAKIEPGNVNFIQLSPTLQATRSNYTQVHRGETPRYLEYFQNAKPHQILLDQLQSEQGARFLKKRNRNIIIKVDDDIEIAKNFIWLTLGQIKVLMRQKNLVNMDTRTVISGIPYGSFDSDVIDFFNFFREHQFAGVYKQEFLKSALSKTGAFNSIENIITFITSIKSNYDLDVKPIPLKSMRNWLLSGHDIRHEEGKYFSVIALDVEIESREVRKWNQPMIQPAQEGICAFVCKNINGLLHIAVQAKLECGNHDIIELAPTVQCLTGNYRQTQKGALPFLDYILNVNEDQIFYDTVQSEEGGRFYREQNRNLIIIAGDEIPVELPENYIWMTINQLYTFLKFNNYLNIQARSLIAAISFV